MTSNINVSAINVTTPVVGTRISASDERNSRVAIKNGLQTAATEITALQNDVANISSSGNFTGIVNFTDGGGFTGSVNNNNLSLTFQYANATQDGQVNSSKFTEWTNKGSSNLTVGNTSTHAFAGDLGVGAVTNITALQGNVSALNNHTANTSNPHNVTKAQIGLSNVTDVTPLELPVSNATQTALNTKQATLVSTTNIKTINGVSILGSGDMVITGGGNISGIAGFTDGNGFTGTITSNSLSLVLQNANETQSGQVTATNFNAWEAKGTSNLTLGATNITAFAGDLGVAATSNITTLQGNVTILTSNIASKGTSNLTVGNTTGTAFDGALGVAAYNHASLTNNPHNVTKTQIGLPNVTDVTPLELPVSNATQTALNLKLNSSQKGATNGLAELVGGTVPASQLPSYVDDIVEVANYAALPVTGETGKIYVTLDTEFLYRWTGSTYAQINGGIVLGETSATAYRGDRGVIAYNHSQVTHDKAFVGLGNVDNTTDLDKPISNLTATALTAKADKSTTINGVNLSSNINLTTANISAVTDKNYVTDSMLSKLNQTAANSNVTYVQGNGTVNGITLIGNVTSGGNLTLGGNLTGVNLSTQITGTLPVANGGTGVTTSTGSGSVVLSTSPNLTTPALGTPASGNLTNCTGYQITGVVTANATGVTTLTANGTTSAQLAASLTDETGSGSNVFNTNCTLVTPALGTPSAVNLTNAVSLPLSSPTYNGSYDVSGWFALGACAYVSADSPTFVMNMTGDATGYLGLGNRIKLAQSATIKYFVVTAIGAYSGGVTPITLYGGTDYTLANAAITLPCFSTHKAPFGFPVNPQKWDVVVELTSNTTTNTPTATTWYNITSINIPIGAFNVSISGGYRVTATLAAIATIDTYVTLSTANNTESEKRMTNGIASLQPIGSAQVRGEFYRALDMLLTTKATLYLNQKTAQTGMVSLEMSSTPTTTVLKARFLYL